MQGDARGELNEIMEENDDEEDEPPPIPPRLTPPPPDKETVVPAQSLDPSPTAPAQAIEQPTSAPLQIEGTKPQIQAILGTDSPSDSVGESAVVVSESCPVSNAEKSVGAVDSQQSAAQGSSSMAICFNNIQKKDEGKNQRNSRRIKKGENKSKIIEGENFSLTETVDDLIAYCVSGNLPYVKMNLFGKDVMVLLDTGATHNAFP